MVHRVALALLPIAAHAQMLAPQHLATLPSALNETSGLLVVDGAVWTMLDSGNPAELYQVSTATGAVTRTLQVLGAANVDWEDLAADDAWVYIGDFGNNAGSRTNLRVYRIPRTALEEEGVTSVQADTIRFSFADQTDFTPAFDNTNFDCEAFVAVDDSLFLFTKRWLDGTTRVYAVAAVPGTHVAQPRGDLDTEGLVTAASWDGAGRLVLLGYEGDPGQPFVVSFSSVQGHAFFAQQAIRRQVDLGEHQTEGIAWLTPDQWVLSNEAAGGFPADLWTIDVAQTTGREQERRIVRAYPVPADDFVRFVGLAPETRVRVRDDLGRIVLDAFLDDADRLDARTLRVGRYLVDAEGPEGRVRMPLVIAR